MLKYVIIFLVVLSSFGCDDMSNVNKAIDTINSDSPSEMQPVLTDVESPFDKAPPEEPQQPTVREYDFDVQTITARNISSQSVGITDPKKRGVISINSNVKALYITSDDTIVEVETQLAEYYHPTHLNWKIINSYLSMMLTAMLLYW